MGLDLNSLVDRFLIYKTSDLQSQVLLRSS